MLTRAQILAEAQEVYQRALETFPGPLADITIELNPRLRTTAGRAYWKTRRLVELNPVIFQFEENRDELRDTVLHELAHIWARKGGHGKEWKILAHVLGAKPEPYHAMRAGVRLNRRVRYWGRCFVCGRWVKLSAVRRNRIVRGLATYYHKGCGGVIEAPNVPGDR
jgi:predicted SprT family Zn-dependent metalloprotease